MQTEISQVYDKTRDELIQYEDSEFVLITSHVPNFYISRNDQTHWGGFLRSIAAELGRMEYFHSYDIVGKDPNYLNPADIRRVWNAPLFINRNYPSDTQYDQDYKTMVINLLTAYKEGATVQGIADVIAAYTGSQIPILELFKYINTAPYDPTYRNTITSFVKALELGDPNTEAYANGLYTISHDLYGAIDLAKPAHVGLQLGLVLGGSDDKFRPIIDEVTTVITLPITYITNGYALMNNTLYQFNGTTWNQVFEPGCDSTSILLPRYYFNGSSWVYGVEPGLTTFPRYCAGLRFIADFEENPLPDPLFEAPFFTRPANSTDNPYQYPHVDTGLASNSIVSADPYYGVSPNVINVYGFFDGATPEISVDFPTTNVTYMAGSFILGNTYQITVLGNTDFASLADPQSPPWVPAVGDSFYAIGAGNPGETGEATSTWVRASRTIISTQQLRVTVPAAAINGPIKVTVSTSTQNYTAYTPVDFLIQTTPVYYSHPGVLSPQMNKAWEIKNDNVDILSID